MFPALLSLARRRGVERLELLGDVGRTDSRLARGRLTCRVSPEVLLECLGQSGPGVLREPVHRHHLRLASRFC